MHQFTIAVRLTGFCWNNQLKQKGYPEKEEERGREKCKQK